MQFDQLKRREFITLLGGAAAWPLAARAQQPDQVRRTTGRVRIIGLFSGDAASDPLWQRRFTVFTQRLQELGWERNSLAFEIRHADGNPDQFLTMAAELVRANVEVIVTGTAGLAAIARKVTSTIPIVTFAGDLEGTGLVASVRRPGGNVTGIQGLHPDLMSKRFAFLKDLVPSLGRVGIVEPITPTGIITARYLEVITDSARALRIEVHRVPVHGPDEFAPAFAAMAREGDQAAVVIINPLSLVHRKEVIGSAAQSRLPTVYESRVFVTGGGLISYGIDPIDLYRQLASYVDNILKGATPSELPVQQPTKFELVINLKTAKVLGLSVPDKLLATADEVIE